MDGRCDINPRTRKDCTRCRFNKCLYVGMRPDLVTNPTPSSTSSTQSSTINLDETRNNHSPKSTCSSSPPLSDILQCANRLVPSFSHHSSQSINRVQNSNCHSASGSAHYSPHYRQLGHPYHQHDQHQEHSRTINTRPQEQPRRYHDLKSYLISTPSIPRPEIALIDTHIQGLTTGEKVKLYEMIDVIHSTLLTPNDLGHFIGDTRTDLNTMTCIFISRVVRAMNMLKSAECLGSHDREILLKSSVGKIIFLRSIPQFDYDNKCWVVYQNPVS